MGVASLARVALFSKEIESISVPTAISQPDSERAVRGVSCQGKTGINKLGNKKTRAAPMVKKLPILTNNLFNQSGRALADSLKLEDALL